jgi:hypothetical protein
MGWPDPVLACLEPEKEETADCVAVVLAAARTQVAEDHSNQGRSCSHRESHVPSQTFPETVRVTNPEATTSSPLELTIEWQYSVSERKWLVLGVREERATSWCVRSTVQLQSYWNVRCAAALTVDHLLTVIDDVLLSTSEETDT